MYDTPFQDIISRVQQQDLEKFEERLKAEKEKKRLLRIQENMKNTNLTTSELVKRITEDEQGSTEEEALTLKPKGKEDGKPPIKGFPPPPTGPVNNG